MRLSCRPTPSTSTWVARASLASVVLLWAGAAPAAPPRVLESVPRVPPTFVENRGQLDPRVAFSLGGRDRQVFFGRDGVTLALAGDGRRHAVRLEFPGARAVAPRGRGPGQGVVSYFKGAPAAWATGAPTWSGLVYEQMWPGIDVIFDLDRDQLKYRFEVAAGADPDRIRLRFRGADGVDLAPDGALVVATSAGSFRDERPLAHQDAADGRREVPARYAAVDSSTWRIDLGPHDPRLPLVVDPQVVVYSGFLGGLGLDEARGAAVDGSGHLYVVGHTESSQATFPATLGPDLTYGGVADAFVAKLDPDGQLVYAGYIGGTLGEEALAVAVDGSGNAYVVGNTLSTQTDGFPLLNGPDLTHNGANDGFVTAVNAAGTGLLYSGYLGGALLDVATTVAVESGGIAYVAGFTSSDTGFPATVGPDLTHNGGTDGFVARLSPAGAIQYCGFVGGSGDDAVLGIATEGSRAYLAGWSASTPAQGFPAAVGPVLTHAGGLDGFVARLNAAGTSFEYAGYLGGNADDDLRAIAVDAGGAAYVTGATQSNDLPAVIGPGLVLRGPSDAVVAKVQSDGASLVYSGYLGGPSDESGDAIGVDAFGRALVAGTSGLSGTPPERPARRPGGMSILFPGHGGHDPTPNGGLDAFLVRLASSGLTIDVGGFLGGSGDDVAHALALGATGDAYLAGGTTSHAPTFPAVRGPQAVNQGGVADAFVARLSACFAVDTTADTVDVSPGDGVCSDFSGQCSLRAAVMESNLHAGRDAICLPPGTYSLTVGGEDGTAAQGDLDITGEVDINGSDASQVFVEDPAGLRRLFHVRSSAQGVDLSRLTVRGGDGGATGGGCIRVEAGASARLHEVVATNCSSEEGGAIQNLGALVVERSEVSYSTAYFSVARAPGSSGGGGAIHNAPSGVLTLDGSTVLRNSADAGGGIENLGSLLLRNSTISENLAPNGGGILASAGSLVIENSTIARNTASGGDGGGIVQQGAASVLLLNSILAGNHDLSPGASDCAGTLSSAGYNLLGDDSGCAFAPGAGDQVGSGMSPIDPVLGPLADNGGPVRTHALLTGSPAFDLGSPAAPGSGGDACQPVDARGFPRPDASRCDIGGHEGLVNASADLALGIVESADPITTGGTVDYTVNVTNNGGDAATGTVLEVKLQGPGALVGVGLSGTCDVVAAAATCQVANIGSGATEAVSLSVQALSPGTITLDVSVSANVIEAAPGDEIASESTQVVGCSKTFDGEADDLWGNPLNWSGDSLPGPSDDVCIGPSFTVTILPGVDGTINALRCDGSLVLAGGLLAPAADSYVAGSYTQSSGTLDGLAIVYLQGSSTWSGGTMTGGGSTLVPPGASLSLNGGALPLAGRLLQVEGSATWQAGAVTASSGGTLHVFSGATFDIQSDQTWASGAGGGAILNGGLLLKSATAGTTTIAVPVSNIGEVRAALGFLNFTGSYTQTAGLTRLQGGFISTTSQLDIQGGELSGAGQITGFVNNSGGVLKPGLSPGTLQITGNYIQGPGGSLQVELGGLAQGTQYDLLTVFGGTANLDGTLDVVLFGGFDPAIGDSFVPITFPSRTGTFASVNTPALSGGRIWQTTHNAGDVTLAVAGIGADLEVQMTDSADPVDVGLTYSYNILVSNLGSAAATATTLSGTLPGSVTRVVTLTGVGSCSGALTNYSCNLGTLNPGDSVLVAVHVLVIGAGGTVNHTATATTSASDGNPANNSALVATTLNAGSCTRYFDNNFGSFAGVWQTANNWGPTNALPTSGTDVCIGEVYQVTLSSGSGDARALRNDGTLTVNTAGGLLRVAADSTSRNTALTSGSLGSSVAGVTITTTGPFTWNGGTLGQGQGILLVPAGQQLDITGPAVKTITNFTLRNQGTVNHLNGPINFGAGTTLIDNQGLFDIQVDAAIQIPFSNSGTLRKTSGTGISSFNGGNFQNQATGVVDVQVGTVDLSAGSTFFGGSSFQGAGLLRLNGGLTSLLGNLDVSAANVELAAGATLSPGNNSLIGNLLWTGGTISGTSFNIPSGSVLTAAGTGSMTLSGCTLNVSGRVDLTSTGAIRPTSGGTIAIHPTGLVDIQSDGSIAFTNPGPYNLSNAGTLRKSGGTNPSLISPVLDSFGGTVETQSGTLRFDGFVTGPTTAIWNTGGGAVVEFTNSASFGTGTQFIGAGAARATAGNTTLQGNIQSSNFELAGAPFTSSATVTGTLAWTAGTLSNGTLTIPAGSTLSISGASEKAVTFGGTLQNEGTTNWSGGNLRLDSGTIDNRASGEFLAQASGRIFTTAGSGFSGLVLNSGIFRKSAGLGTTAIGDAPSDPVNFDNIGGSLHAESGTLRFGQPLNQTAGLTTVTTGSLQLDSGFTLQGGVLAGTGTISGSVTNSGGAVRPGSSAGLFSSGQLTITGNYSQSGPAQLDIEVQGPVAGSQYDRLAVGGTASLGGTLDVTDPSGTFTPTPPQTFDLVTFASSSGSFGAINNVFAPAYDVVTQPTSLRLQPAGPTCTTPPGYDKTWVSGSGTPGDWSTAGNWSPSGVPTATDDVFICAAASAQPIVSVNVPTKDLLVETGANISTSPGTTITAGGNVDASGPIGGHGKLTMTGVGVTLRGMVPNLEITGSTSLLGATQALGQVISRGTLTLAGQTLMAGGGFATQDATGTLVMTNPADVLEVNGNVAFAGGSTAGTLTAGQLRFTGDFSENSSFVSTAFAASGNHVTVFRSPVGHAVGLVHAGSGSQFQAMQVEAPFLSLLTPVVAGGTLIEGTPAVARILGGQPLSVSGLDVDGLVFDNVPLSSTGGTITRFDNVTFQNMAPSAVQLTLDHPGAAGMFVFDNTRFLTTPSTGLYISSTDSAAGLPVSWVRFVNSTPCDGTAFTQVASGAIVSWPCQTYELTIADAAQPEGDAGSSLMGFLVTLSAPSPSLVQANYASAPGSATAGLDYQDVSGLVQISPGQTQFLIQVPVLGDLLPEGPESLRVDLSAAVGATLLDDRGEGTIDDDDDCIGFQATTVESVAADTLTSVAAGADGLPRLAYVSSGNLRYARFDGQAWQYETVDSGVLAESSMALDPSDGEPGIAYIKGGRMNYAKRSPGGTWALTTIPGSYPTVTGHRYTLRFDPSGHPGVSFVTGIAPAGPWNLAFAAFDGSVWTVHSGLDAQACPHVSHDFEPDGDPVVAYCKFPFASEQLWRARLQGGSWNTGVIDDHFGNTNRVGFSNQLRALPGGGFGVAYYNLTLGDLHYATAADFAGPWTVGNIETAGAVGDYAGLAVFGGRPRASYVSNGVGIRFAELLGSWVPEPVAATPNAIGTSVAAGPNGADHVTWYDRTRLEVRHARRAACLADFGDAPAPYPTLAAQGGARHSGFGLRSPQGIPILQLGLELDAEPDGQPDPGATGDDLADLDDEDGVTFAGPLVGGTMASVTVTTSISLGSGRLDAWVDFDRNGSWNDAGEQVFASTVVNNGPNSLSFAVPFGVTPGTSYARFRISGLGGLLPTGTTSGGEVEDHQVTLQAPPQVDLTVLKSAPAPVVPVGGSFTYTIGVTNSVANGASNVVVLDTLPAEVAQVSAIPSQGSCAGDPAIVCHLGSLAAGASASVAITVNAVASGPAVLNTAMVSADEPDSFPSDNGASATIRINAAPTVSTIPPQSTPEDVATPPLAFTIGDDFTPHGSLLVSATSSDQVLVPDANLALGGSLANRTLVATPAPDRSGFTDITITVTDGDGLSATTMFRLTVTPQDDPPTLDPIPPLNLLEDAPLQTVGLSGITAGPFETGTLALGAVSGNTALVPNPAVSYVSPNPTGSLSFTPVPDANGAATVTVTVDDAVFTTPRTFTVTVNAVNDAPTLDPIAPVSVLEDSGPQGVGLTGIGVGPANEAGQSLTVTATSDNPAVVPNPVVSYTSPGATGSLTLTPVANAHGSATITVTVRDSGGVANGGLDTVARTFTFTVTPVNDPPTLDPIADRTLSVSAGAQSVPLMGISIGPSNEAPQTITILAASDNAAVVPTPSVSYTSPAATGSLLITPAGVGSAVVTVTARDSGGTANGGIDTVVRSFTVTVTSGPPTADLAITKVATPSPAGVGQTLVYTLTTTNAGPAAAAGVTVFDYLPSGVDFVSAPGCTRLDRVVTCPVGNLAATASSVFTVTVTPTVSAASLGNSAVVTSATLDPVPGNDTATVTTPVLYTADLHLSLADAPDPVLAGEPLTYSFGLANSGPSPATAAAVTLPLPSGASFGSASAGCSLQAGSVVCSLGSLAPGEARNLAIVVLPGVPGTLHATATASSGEEFDPTPSDNQASVTTTVSAAADLSVTLTATPEPVTLNADLTYTLTVTNHGPQAAANAVLYDYLPSAITPVMVPGGCTVAGRVVACSLGSLAASQVVNVTLVVRPTQAPASLTNTALVVSQTADPDSGNDTATATSSVVSATVAAQMAAPTPGSVLGGSAVTFSWTSAPGALEYWLDIGRAPGSRKLASVSAGAATSKQVTGLPEDGSVLFVRLWTRTAGGWAANDYSYQAGSAATATAAHLTSPVPGTTLLDSTVSFTWSGGHGVVQYWLDIGSTPGAADLFSGPAGTASSLSVSGLPTDGRTVHVRLWSQLPTEWAFDDQAYVAHSAGPLRGRLVAPAPGSALTGTTAAFSWTAGNQVLEFWLDVGTSLGGNQIYSATQGLAATATVGGLPQSGGTLHVRLWSRLPGAGWVYDDATYTAFDTTPPPAQAASLGAPAPGSTLPAPVATFAWNGGVGVLEYWLEIGTSLGGRQIYSASQALATSRSVAGIPSNGAEVFVRLWSRLPGSGWARHDVTYRAPGP